MARNPFITYSGGEGPSFFEVIGIIAAVIVGCAICVCVALSLMVCCVLVCCPKKANPNPNTNNNSANSHGRQSFFSKFLFLPNQRVL